MLKTLILLFIGCCSSCLFAQLDVKGSDSLSNYLLKKFIEIDPSNISIEGDVELFPNPMVYAPLHTNCKDIPPIDRKDCTSLQILTFIEKNVKIPSTLSDSTFHARVIVQFLVDKNALVTNIEVYQSSSKYFPQSMKTLAYLIDEEATRVISMLKFTEPAIREGKPEKILLTIPIKFYNP